MDRRPKVEVRRILSREVGFGCPVPDCGSPYLEWHHFDPPWHVREHHDPKGMIALCSEHHPIADGGAFTVEQLHEFKRNGASNREALKGKFSWLRNKLLLVVGGDFYYETLTAVVFRGEPMIWLERDENGYLLLSLRMLTKSGEPRLRLENNHWLERGSPLEFDCPPSGKMIRAKYSNGDMLKVEFVEVTCKEDLEKRHPGSQIDSWNKMLGDERKITFPLTVIEISMNVGGTDIKFGATKTELGGMHLSGNFSAFCAGGKYIG